MSRSELAEREPVGKCQLDVVPDTASPLKRRACEPQPAEGFLRLATEVFLGVPVEQDHPAATVECLDGCGNSRNSGARNCDVCGMAVRKHEGVYSARCMHLGERT